MKKSLAILMVILFVAACGKSGVRQPLPPQPPQPAASAVPTPPSVPQPVVEAKPFVIPASAKKQAKYFPEGTPSRAIQDLDDMLDSYVLDPKTPEDKQYNTDLKKAVLHGTFDLRELCRLALDKHWADRTPEEQDAFVDLMTRLLEKKAIFSKEQGQKKRKSKTVYKVTYEGHKFLNPDQAISMAMSMVHIPSESMKIELNYKLKKVASRAPVGSAWMIFDVIVDGASLLDNYKYQFDKIIGKEGYPNLIRRMETKLKELQEKDQEKDQEEPVSP